MQLPSHIQGQSKIRAAYNLFLLQLHAKLNLKNRYSYFQDPLFQAA
jgi:hypothetical protein